jgi:hypothetical protein
MQENFVYKVYKIHGPFKIEIKKTRIQSKMDTPRQCIPIRQEPIQGAQPIRLVIPDRVAVPIQVASLEHWDADAFWKKKFAEMNSVLTSSE